jgi:hypothetical protein
MLAQASPHIAGLAAYLLSLYPDVFVPTIEDYDAETLAEAAVEEFTDVWRSSRQFVFGKVGQWTGINFAAPSKGHKKHPRILPPAVLKKAMIRALRSHSHVVLVLIREIPGIASSGLLHDLPAGTIDRLAFNVRSSQNPMV